MTTEARAPRLLVIVANGITGDSRVQKTAVAAARAGWEVTLLGTGGRRGRRQTTMMGEVTVIRLPVTADYARRSKGNRVRRMVTQTTIRNQEGLVGVNAAYQAWLRQATARIGRMRTSDGPAAVVLKPASKALGAAVKARRLLHRLRVKAFKWEERQVGRPTGSWQRDQPSLVDLDLVFGPVIEKLQPDVIHANDVTTIHTVALSVARMRARGQKVAWLYDAHEYIAGIDWPKPREDRAYKAVEREFVGQADAVVTVSPEIARMLRENFKLPETPLVVRNAPIREVVGKTYPKPSVREACGVAEGVPLMVYSGWLAPARGVGTAVSALPLLPGVHLAIVAGRASAEQDALRARAAELGVEDRVHVVPYVPQYAVPDYLSSADLGLICLRRIRSHEISLPTKLAEYLHAGLPVIVSDLPVQVEFVQRTRIGEIFVVDDTEDFAEAVKRALEHKAELVANISDALLQEFSWERQAEGLIELYRRIAPRAPKGTRPDIPWDVDEGAAATPPAVLETAPGPLPTWRPLDVTATVRLGLGPANYAGQLATFAQAICRDNAGVTAEVVMRRSADSYVFPADVYVDRDRQGELDVQMEQVRRVVGRYTHLIVDAFLPVFGYLNGDTIEGDLPALRRAGIKVALLAHGSEIRHPLRHRDRYPFSLFHDAPKDIVPRYAARAERNRRIAEESGLPLFVTTPDLLDDLPAATWSPLVVDVDSWTSDEPVMERSRPKVLHGPSQRWTKGTDRILPVLTELHDKGAIELVLAERVPWETMRELVRTCDIVVDQFAVGSYGTFAVEAMAAGRPVVGYLDERVHKAAGVRPPIVNVTPDRIGEALESLLDDRARTVEIAKESVAFAQEYHDGRRTAQVFADFLRP
ncbi:glycosyltransferase family 4 protein [Actinoplanes aureus]|uniref:Glycosyltransferase n=1 Tax=Actinoplanes aureus TaxID=2792083 RepID=A0A931C6Z2_9ACTN|nr:glycosyltransferase [Actinoplanes aureus]MBG0561608.1 glycosyltransferase [Actinoplanes aureus]